jgi:hypothetical protein
VIPRVANDLAALVLARTTKPLAQNVINVIKSAISAPVCRQQDSNFVCKLNIIFPQLALMVLRPLLLNTANPSHLVTLQTLTNVISVVNRAIGVQVRLFASLFGQYISDKI